MEGVLNKVEHNLTKQRCLLPIKVLCYSLHGMQSRYGNKSPAQVEQRQEDMLLLKE
jgi:hypothetical protein